MGTRIVQVDPVDASAFAAWHAVYAAADRFGREEHATPWGADEIRLDKQTDLKTRWTAAFALLEDDEPVSVADVWLPLMDNRDLAEINVYTHPDHLRRGHGSRLLQHLETLMRDRGRTKLLAQSAYPLDAPADGTGSPGPDFLVSHGYSFALGDIRRTLELPVADEVLDRLSEDAAPHHLG